MPLPEYLRIARFRHFLVLLTALTAAPNWALAAQPGGKAPGANEFDEFIAKQEKLMEAARKRLLQAIAKRDAAVRRSRNLDADAIRTTRDTIERDRKAFVDAEKVPRSDELLDATIACLEQYQAVAERIEKFRLRLAEKAVRVDDVADMARFTKLEERLNEVLIGRKQFTTGSVWVGQRHTNNGAFLLRLTIKDVTGSSFKGDLAQTNASGRTARMEVEGKLSGNRIAFQNTEILRGKDRNLWFRGYVLSDRIITSIAGISTDGKPVAGCVSLWSNGVPKANRR